MEPIPAHLCARVCAATTHTNPILRQTRRKTGHYREVQENVQLTMGRQRVGRETEANRRRVNVGDLVFCRAVTRLPGCRATSEDEQGNEPEASGDSGHA